MQGENITPFSLVYDSFLSKITDDMYMELTESDTYKMLQELLITSIHKFEFPRINLDDYVLEYNDFDEGAEDEPNKGIYEGIEADGQQAIVFLKKGGYFNTKLSGEEINILSTYMIVEWLGYQLASVENTRMKYSGSDFKFTSQANHMSKLLTLKRDYEREGFHLQRLYKRRKKDENGIMRSTFDSLIGK